MTKVGVTGSFDNLTSNDVRFLEEAAKLGDVHVVLWPDETAHSLDGQPPRFPQEERRYLLDAIRYVSRVTLVAGPIARDAIPFVDGDRPDMWVVDEASDNARKREFCRSQRLEYRVLRQDDLRGFPLMPPVTDERAVARKKVLVTGSFDWLHSGHVRFFEEVSALGDLFVVVGHDDNIRLLKGPGHPLFPQERRRYMVQSVRHVKRALISTGRGWMDAAPEIDIVRPDIYAVNEDGDQPEKRAFCKGRGLTYVVLKRTPKEGLPMRQSTELRGF